MFLANQRPAKNSQTWISDGLLLFQDRHLALQMPLKPREAFESQRNGVTVMVWIIDEKINKVRQVGLGSQAMMDAKDVFLDESEAKDVFRATCKHPTRLANSKTRRVSCADCNAAL